MNAGPANSVTAERYRAFADIPRFALGNNLELVYSPLTRTAITVPALGVGILQACRSFATLADHTAQLARQLGLAPDQTELLRRQTASLVQARLLVSHGDLVNHCRRHSDSHDNTARITTIGVPTRDRTDALQRCLVSYLESVRRAGRSCDFVVVDGSDKPETAARSAVFVVLRPDRILVSLGERICALRPDRILVSLGERIAASLGCGGRPPGRS
jgi:hypothetical protein